MTISRPTYASVDDLSVAADFNPASVRAASLERHLEHAASKIDDGMRRRFYPLIQTRTYQPRRYVRPAGMDSSGIWLDDDLTSLTSVTVDGAAETIADLELWPLDGPPYSWLGVTGNEISIVGVWGYRYTDIDVTTVNGAISDATGTTVNIDDGSQVGVGDLILIDTERMLVTRKASIDTGQNIGADLAANVGENTVTVSDGTGFTVGETLFVNSERMRIVDIIGNNLIVVRAWLGSTIAAHTTGDDVYAMRSLTVERGAAGSTAATHSDAATVTKATPPAVIRDLVIAEALVAFEQEASRYGRTIGSGESEMEARGAGLNDLRTDARRRYQRRLAGAV